MCDKHPDCYDQSDESNCNHGDDKDSGSSQLHGQYIESYSNIVVMFKILGVNSHICIRMHVLTINELSFTTSWCNC